jgi:hypothetical protein
MIDFSEVDPFPGRPKVLFIGLAHSSHTHAWINLLENAALNIRLFAVPGTFPPDDCYVRTYVPAFVPVKNPAKQVSLYVPGVKWLSKRVLRRLGLGRRILLEQEWLATIIGRWKPDIIHTLGLDPAGHFYFQARNEFKLAGIGTWVLQLRGGSDLTLTRFDPALAPHIAEVLRACDQLLSDNRRNFDYAREMGIREEQIAPIAPMPGTGGVDVASLSQAWAGPPSQRRMILWPKAYTSTWSVALPVLEALKLCWAHLPSCELYMLAMTPDVHMWYNALPKEIRDHSYAEERISRQRVLDLMVRARVMLAPSLVDGTPNTMFEAMASGAFPILSPLETITRWWSMSAIRLHEIFTPEIADALVRAMTDDALVDSAAERNLELVRRVADRATIGPRVIAYYETLAESAKVIGAMKFAVLSHVLPPSPSGQATVLGELLKPLPSDSYCFISRQTYENREQSAHYYHLKTPSAVSARLAGWQNKSLPVPVRKLLGLSVHVLRRIKSKANAALLWNASQHIEMRARQIRDVLRAEASMALIACTGDLYDLPAGYLASRLTGVVFVPYMFDDYAYQWTGSLRAFALRQEPEIVRNAARIIVTNEFMAAQYERRYGVQSTLIRNPSTLSDLATLDQAPARFDRSALNIVYTGSVYHAQFDAFRNLITAIGELQRANNHMKLKLHLFTSQ